MSLGAVGGAEGAVGGDAMAEGAAVAVEGADSVGDEHPAATAPTFTVVSIGGETVLPEQKAEPASMTVRDVLGMVPNPGRFDKLILGTNDLERDVLIAEVLCGDDAKGGKTEDSGPIVLTFVRVNLGTLAGLDDATVDQLADFGAVQESPPEFEGVRHCVSLCKIEEERFSGGGFGGHVTTRQVVLLPDGRILAKYEDVDDYMEHSGDYHCSSCWQIAEGHFEPEGDGRLRVEWASWAELRHRNTEPFGTGTPTAPWESKVIDPVQMRLPSVLVPMEGGFLNLQSLCNAWAQENEMGLANARKRRLRTRKSSQMPNLSEDALRGLGFDPRHLVFWQKGLGPELGPGARSEA